MKFSRKLTLSILLLVALCLSLNGTLTIMKNHADMMEMLAQQNAQLHDLDAAQIESETANTVSQRVAAWIADASEHGELITDYSSLVTVDGPLLDAAGAVSAQGAQDNRGLAVLLADGSVVFSAMPEAVTQNALMKALRLAPNKYLLFQTADAFYMMMASPLIINGRDACFVSAYDVTAVFQLRNQQLQNLTLFNCVTLAAAAGIAVALSRVLTKPLARLKAASERIAAGRYDARTDIRTNDEFADLGQGFDRMAAEIEQRNDRLEKNLQQHEDFVSAFTHEIKTPMTTMLGYASMLRAEMPDPQEQRMASDYIWRETGRLEALSKKLMLLVGLRTDTIELEPVSIQSVFAGLRKSLPPAANQASVEFVIADNANVLADRVLLDDLLRNLILNAQHACRPADRIQVCATVDQDRVLLSVSDTGCGIAPEDIPHLTQPFYMVDKSRARDGGQSGLGLALAQRIAELHGTVLDFQSEVGVGTTVRFWLRCAQEVD